MTKYTAVYLLNSVFIYVEMESDRPEPSVEQVAQKYGEKLGLEFLYLREHE